MKIKNELENSAKDWLRTYNARLLTKIEASVENLNNSTLAGVRLVHEPLLDDIFKHIGYNKETYEKYLYINCRNKYSDFDKYFKIQFSDNNIFLKVL